MKIHDFKQSLASSHKASDLPIWHEIYKQAFPSMAATVDHREDGEHQRAGIDRSVILSNSKQILVDEKIRWKAYSDIALEYWSDRDRKIPGGSVSHCGRIIFVMPLRQQGRLIYCLCLNYSKRGLKIKIVGYNSFANARRKTAIM